MVVAVLVVVLVAVLVAEDVGVVVTLAESVVVGVLRAHVANVPSRNESTMSLRYATVASQSVALSAWPGLHPIGLLPPTAPTL